MSGNLKLTAPLFRARQLKCSRTRLAWFVVAVSIVVGTTVLSLLFVPKWAFEISCAALWFALLLFLWNDPTLLARYRQSRGHCPHCGYDLTGNVSGICTECGTAIKIA